MGLRRVDYQELVGMMTRHGEAYGALSARAWELLGVRERLDECLHSPTVRPTPELFAELRDAARGVGEAVMVYEETQERLLQTLLSAANDTYYFDGRD